MRVIINLFLFSTFGVVAALSAISTIGEAATETVQRKNVAVVYDSDYEAAVATRVAETLRLKSIFGDETKEISVRLERKNGVDQVWIGYELDAENAAFSAAVYKVIASAISSRCFDGRRTEIVLCRSFNDPLLTVPSHPDLNQLVIAGEDVVFFDGELSESDALDFADSLKQVDYLRDQGGTLRLDRQGNQFLVQEMLTTEKAKGLQRDSLEADIRVLRKDVFHGAAVRWEFFQDIDQPFEHLSVSVPSVGYAPLEYVNGLVTIDHGPELDRETLDRIADQFVAMRNNSTWLRIIRNENQFEAQFPGWTSEMDSASTAVVELMGRQVLNELAGVEKLTAHACDRNLESQFAVAVTSKSGTPHKLGNDLVFVNGVATEEDASQLVQVISEAGFFDDSIGLVLWLTKANAGTTLQVAFPPEYLGDEAIQDFQRFKSHLRQVLYTDEPLTLLVGGLLGSLDQAVEISDAPTGEIPSGS